MPINQDAGTVTKKVVKSSPGIVKEVIATNTNAAARWFQLHNKATAPVATDVPFRFYPLPAGSAAQPTVLELYEENLDGGEELSAGVSWAISTTPGTFTDAATAADHTVSVRIA